MKYHPTMPVEQAQIMLRLSLKGINIGLHTYTHTYSLMHSENHTLNTYTPRAYIVSVSLSSLNTSSSRPQKVCITVLIYIHEVQQMQPDVFTSAKKITPAGALQHETFQLKCNFHPHCWGMKPGERQKMGYDRKAMAEGEKNKRLEREREGGMKEGRSKSLRFQEMNLNRREKILVGKIRLCKPDLC